MAKEVVSKHQDLLVFGDQGETCFFKVAKYALQLSEVSEQGTSRKHEVVTPGENCSAGTVLLVKATLLAQCHW